MQVVESPSCDDIKQTEILISSRKTKVWKWQEEGESKSRTQVYVDVYYGKPENPFVFTVEDVSTYQGIKVSGKSQTAYMSINLPSDISNKIKTVVDNAMFNKCYAKRADLFAKGNKITQQSEMKIMYQGLIRDGDEKKDKDGNVTGGNWPDQLTCTVPTKKKANQVIIDEQQCTIEDLDGKPYSWMALDGKKLKEVVIQVDRIVFDKDICVRGKYRLIVVNDKTAPRFMTKRRLEQVNVSAHNEKKPRHDDPESHSNDIVTETPNEEITYTEKDE